MSQHDGAITVSVRARHGKGAARELRRQGLIPAVLYGKGQDNLSLSLDPHALRRATDPERALNTLFSLTIKEDGKADVVEPAVISEIQRDAIRDDVVHVDFMRVDVDKPVQRKVPVRYSGRAEGVAKGGKLRTFKRHVRVSARPADVPVALHIDVTPLDEGQYLRVKDVSLPETKILERPDSPLAFVEAAKAKKEEEAEAEPKGKKK
jgi:large subunit ribosomal protein L25